MAWSLSWATPSTRRKSLAAASGVIPNTTQNPPKLQRSHSQRHILHQTIIPILNHSYPAQCISLQPRVSHNLSTCAIKITPNNNPPNPPPNPLKPHNPPIPTPTYIAKTIKCNPQKSSHARNSSFTPPSPPSLPPLPPPPPPPPLPPPPPPPPRSPELLESAENCRLLARLVTCALASRRARFR